MTQHQHSLVVGIGFTLAYVGAMGLMLVMENSRLKALSHGLVTFGLIPAVVAGLLMIGVAKVMPLTDPVERAGGPD